MFFKNMPGQDLEDEMFTVSCSSCGSPIGEYGYFAFAEHMCIDCTEAEFWEDDDEEEGE